MDTVWIDIIKLFIVLALELTFLFIIISFIVNLLQGLVPFKKIEKKLAGRNKYIGGVFALVFAFITPFCSCSTIPVIVNMLKRKFNFGVVMVFLFASPVLDPTIITVMGVMLGWKVAVIYTVTTMLFSFLLGFLLESLGMQRQVKNVVMSGYGEKGTAFSVKNAWKETMQLMKTVGVYILLGAAIGSIIKGAVPTEWVAQTFGQEQWWLVPVAAIIGIPLYIRLASMIPISQILIMKGMALGPVMAMMISSAGASLPEVVLLHSIFKKKLVFIFVGSVITMATLSGFIFYVV